nr:MAG TPA: Protein of unknown function (DUF2612) [Caudoviricetes sp.]
MRTNEKEYYRGLMTSEYRGSPKFNDMVRGMVDYGCKLDIAILKMIAQFDIDTAADAQLDILGAIVGVSRNLNFSPSAIATSDVKCPSPSEMVADTGATSIYDTIETPVAVKSSDAKTIVVGWVAQYLEADHFITDDVYRTMIKCKIIQNIWKGSVADLYEMWNVLFPANQKLQIQDLQDMSYNIVLLGDYSQLMQELIAHGYIVPKPEGVRINLMSFISTEGLPIFAYKYNTLNYNGYNSHWIETTKTDTSGSNSSGSGT